MDALYNEHGEYSYSGGWNMQALMAFIIGVLPCLPGYLAVAGIISKDSVPDFLEGLFSFGWFFSLLVAGIYYYVMAGKQYKLRGATA